MHSDAELTGQIVRVYAPDRFTIWCLDDQRAYGCYVASSEDARVGAIVRFALSPDRRLALRPCVIGRDLLTPAQLDHLVPLDDEFDVEPTISKGALRA